MKKRGKETSKTTQRRNMHAEKKRWNQTEMMMVMNGTENKPEKIERNLRNMKDWIPIVSITIYRVKSGEVSITKFYQIGNYINPLQCTYQGQNWNYQGLVLSGIS